jgi:hypothetical protein
MLMTVFNCEFCPAQGGGCSVCRDDPPPSAQLCCLEAFRDDGWHIVGQYPSHAEARRIAADYKRRGERTRIVSE